MAKSRLFSMPVDGANIYAVRNIIKSVFAAIYGRRTVFAVTRQMLCLTPFLTTDVCDAIFRVIFCVYISSPVADVADYTEFSKHIRSMLRVLASVHKNYGVPHTVIKKIQFKNFSRLIHLLSFRNPKRTLESSYLKPS